MKDKATPGIMLATLIVWAWNGMAVKWSAILGWLPVPPMSPVEATALGGIVGIWLHRIDRP